MINHKSETTEVCLGRFMSKKIALGILLGILMLLALLLYTGVPNAESANFVSRAIHIRTDGTIDPPDAPVDIHGTTYTLTGDIQCPRGDYCIYIERSGILLDGYGYALEGGNPQELSNSGRGIYIGSVSNIEIRNITIRGCVYGIEAQNASKVNLHNITIDGEIKAESSDEQFAIFLLQSHDITIDQNQLVNNYMGILTQYSDCVVTNNRIMDNTGAGVNLQGSSISIISNLIAKNDLGMQIDGSNYLIKANDILSNKRIGVFLSGSQNVFIENNIQGHNDNLSGYGVQMDPFASSNTFYHNDFADNNVHVEGGDLAAVSNVWDSGYSQGGNYWDTYHGIDNYSGYYQNETESDGVGDTSYQITQTNIDRYPLMTPFRSAQSIEEKTPKTNDYTLPTIITAIIVAGVIASSFTLYLRRKKKQTPTENVSPPAERTPAGRFIIPVFLTLSIMVILNFTSISAGTYGLGAIGLFGGALYFDEILIGFLSSAAAIFVTWRIIIRKRYTNKRWMEMLFATFAAFLFTVYLLAYTTYRPFELFGLLQALQPALVMIWTFATSLFGCFFGFILGGIGLKRMKSPSNTTAQLERRQKFAFYRVGIGVVLIFMGFVSGYVAGYIIWAILGQAQIESNTLFSISTKLPPPLVYLLGWSVAGATIFLLGLIRRFGIKT
jgi:parallel beta-helix repeat protein